MISLAASSYLWDGHGHFFLGRTCSYFHSWWIMDYALLLINKSAQVDEFIVFTEVPLEENRTAIIHAH